MIKPKWKNLYNKDNKILKIKNETYIKHKSRFGLY